MISESTRSHSEEVNADSLAESSINNWTDH
jgi:hypothetical protein